MHIASKGQVRAFGSWTAKALAVRGEKGPRSTPTLAENDACFPVPRECPRHCRGVAEVQKHCLLSLVLSEVNALQSRDGKAF